MPTLPWVSWTPEGSRSWFRLTFFFTLILARADCNLERCFIIMVFQAPPHFTPRPMSRSYTSTCCTHNDTSVTHWSTQACASQVTIKVEMFTLAKWIRSFVSFRSLVLLMISCRTDEYFCVSHTSAKSCLIFWRKYKKKLLFFNGNPS